MTAQGTALGRDSSEATQALKETMKAGSPLTQVRAWWPMCRRADRVDRPSSYQKTSYQETRR